VARTVENSGYGLCNVMMQIAKSEYIMDRLQLAEFAGCKIKSVDELSVILACFRLQPILRFLYIFSEVNFYYIFYQSIATLSKSAAVGLKKRIKKQAG
jgi:hypothetical protein